MSDQEPEHRLYITREEFSDEDHANLVRLGHLLLDEIGPEDEEYIIEGIRYIVRGTRETPPEQEDEGEMLL